MTNLIPYDIKYQFPSFPTDMTGKLDYECGENMYCEGEYVACNSYGRCDCLPAGADGITYYRDYNNQKCYKSTDEGLYIFITKQSVLVIYIFSEDTF